MEIKNQLTMKLQSLSENVGIARIAAAAFAAQADLPISEIDEIKVAVSEAVSNSVIHGYGNDPKAGIIECTMTLYEEMLEYIVIDYGKGIEDITLARQASYSSDPERMGLGFVFMESFMDELEVRSEVGQGTTVRMCKKISPRKTH